jgi:hypothetical protein
MKGSGLCSLAEKILLEFGVSLTQLLTTLIASGISRPPSEKVSPSR